MNPKLILLIGAGALLYFWMQSQQTATATPTSSGTTGGTPPPPAGGSDSTPPAPPAPTLTTFGEPAMFTGQGGTQIGTPDVLTGLYLDMLAWASTDPNFAYTSQGANPEFSASPYHWNTLLAAIWPDPPKNYTGTTWPPAIATVFPSVDATALMNGTDYWNAMSAYLSARGLSGLRGMSGLGRTLRIPYKGGWAA